MSEQVYLKFGIESEYFEIEVESMDAISTELIQNMPVERKKWGSVIIRNKPYKYRQNAISANNLYTEITSKEATQYIFIKHVGNETDVTEGYFGIVDCEIDDTEKKFIKVTPEILDQYTDLLEYMDTKVNVFEVKNVILNSNFSNFSNNKPLHWDNDEGVEYFDPAGVFMLDATTIHLRSRGYVAMKTYYEIAEELTLNQAVAIWGAGNFEFKQKTTTIYQESRPIYKGNKVFISMFYQLLEHWTTNESRAHIYMLLSVLRSDGVTVYANNDNQWSTTSSPLTIRDNKRPLPNDNISDFEYMSKVLPDVGYDGELTVKFFSIYVPSNNIPDLSDPSSMALAFPEYRNDGWTYYETSLILTNIEIKSSPFLYKNVKIQLLSENIEIKQTYDILDENNLRLAKEFSAWIPKKEVEMYEEENGNIMNYYVDEEDNSPDINNMSTPVMLMYGIGEAGHELTVGGYVDLFKDRNSNFYKGEICQVDMYQLERWSRYGLKRYQVLRVEISFAREKVFSLEEYTDQDLELEAIPEGSVVGDPKPPSEDDGWELEGDYDPIKGWVWVRTPFNGTIDEWDVTDSGEGYRDGEKFLNKKVLKKRYPSSENTKEYPTSVHLRDVIKAVFNKTHEGLADKDVYSTFLWNDYPEGELTDRLLYRLPMLTIEPNTNYYTKSFNNLKNISCLHTYDLRTVKKVNDADADLFLSFKDLMDDLMVKFPHLYYFVDEDKNLHLEHLSYEDYTGQFVPIIDEATGYKKWKYDKAKMFAVVDYNSINAGYRDFVSSSMMFDKIVSNRRRMDIRESKKTMYLTSDVQYCMENPNEISNGLILLNYDEVGDENILRAAVGMLSGTTVVNGDLSIANMLTNFGSFEGTWKAGEINGRQTEFLHTKWTMIGTDQIELKGIFKEKYFYTEIGVGIPVSRSLDYRKQCTLIDLTYRYHEYLLVAGNNNILEL